MAAHVIRKVHVADLNARVIANSSFGRQHNAFLICFQQPQESGFSHESRWSARFQSEHRQILPPLQ